MHSANKILKLATFGTFFAHCVLCIRLVGGALNTAHQVLAEPTKVSLLQIAVKRETSSLYVFKIQSTQLVLFGGGGELLNFDQICFHIYRGVGTGVAGVGRATPRIPNLVKRNFEKWPLLKSVLLRATLDKNCSVAPAYLYINVLTLATLIIYFNFSQ